MSDKPQIYLACTGDPDKIPPQAVIFMPENIGFNESDQGLNLKINNAIIVVSHQFYKKILNIIVRESGGKLREAGIDPSKKLKEKE